MTQIKKHNFEQRSEAWEKIRVGKVGASEAVGLTTPARMKTLIWKKLAEQLTGEQEEVYVTEAMNYGIETEPIVINLYEQETFTALDSVGYITNEDYPLLGLSPDGIHHNGDMEMVGAVEVKCPMPKKHVETIITNQVPSENRPQLAQYFLILGEQLQWLDFISYNEKVKAKPLHIIRVTRDDMLDDIAKLQKGYGVYSEKINEYLKFF